MSRPATVQWFIVLVVLPLVLLSIAGTLAFPPALVRHAAPHTATPLHTAHAVPLDDRFATLSRAMQVIDHQRLRVPPPPPPAPVLLARPPLPVHAPVVAHTPVPVRPPAAHPVAKTPPVAPARAVDTRWTPGDECAGVPRVDAFTPVLGQFRGVFDDRYIVPAGCFAGVWSPAPVSWLSGFGWCNWWPEDMRHVTRVDAGVATSAPVVGATIYFPPSLNGGVVGHYGYVEYIYPTRIAGQTWILMSEMNMTWRGAGFGRVNFQFVPVTAGQVFYH